MRWNDPETLLKIFIQDIQHASYGHAEYQIVETIHINDFPVFEDGFTYTSEEYMAGWRKQRGFHEPDRVSYPQFIQRHRLVERINDQVSDEIWMMGFPFGGFYESRMVGPGAVWCNSPALSYPGKINRRFIIMAFNYERGVGEMLESYGHRAESIMAHVYRDFPDSVNLWKRFTMYDLAQPGRAEVGTIHYAPNSVRDYDWGNRRKVLSNHRAWFQFPELAFQPTYVDCKEWDNGDPRAHHLWWFQHIPHTQGETHSVSNNWWEYIVNPNRPG